MIPLTRPLVDFAEVAEDFRNARMGGEVVEQVVAQLRRVIEGGA